MTATPAAEEAAKVERPILPLALAANSPEALDSLASRVADYLERTPAVRAGALAYSLSTSASSGQFRRVVLFEDLPSAVAGLREGPRQGVVNGSVHAPSQGVAFMYPGPGTHSRRMLEEIYEHDPVFQSHVDRCTASLRSHVGDDFAYLTYAAGSPARGDDINQPIMVYCALFAVEFALTQLWMSWGVRASFLIGFSFGEIVAAAVSSVFQPEDAIKLVFERSRLLQSLPKGAMTSVALSADAARKYLTDGVDVAVLRTDKSCTVAGSLEAICGFEERLRAANVRFMRSDVELAAHTRAVEPLMPAFSEAVTSVERRPPEIPIVSNVTGTWLTDQEAVDPDYWARQMRQPVSFAPALHTLVDGGCRVLLEVGPGDLLTAVAASEVGRVPGMRVLPSTRGLKGDLKLQAAHLSDYRNMVRSLARLWTTGVNVDWTMLFSREHRQRVALPAELRQGIDS